MKKKLLVGLIGCMLAFSLVGCGGETTTLNVNVENKEELSDTTLGKSNLLEIGNNLYYDSATRIVYMRCNNSYGSFYSAYYAPNGLPYRYNPETNTFEEIKFNNK